LCRLRASALVDANGERRDSRFAVFVRIDDSSPPSSVRPEPGLNILHVIQQLILLKVTKNKRKRIRSENRYKKEREQARSIGHTTALREFPVLIIYLS
jgi:hypothetical protein